MSKTSEPASRDEWTLVRNARQLLTLRGPSGPRRGSAMATSLNVVKNGALLIRNGVIQDVGPSRRVENLAGARKAREIDATGKLVMPAFVDADMALVIPAPLQRQSEGSTRDCASALRIMSRKRVQAGATEMAAEWARYGCLTVGAHTGCASDLKNIGKVLRTHQALQSKPLRIRSI
ncbi:MAG TPA: hypothetical protein VGL72_06845, partial [Bryobacteraceae bacterium]